MLLSKILDTHVRAARHSLRVRARQNFKIVKMSSLLIESTFQVILNISKNYARMRPRARHARTKHVLTINLSFFCMNLKKYSFISPFRNFQSFWTRHDVMRAR